MTALAKERVVAGRFVLERLLGSGGMGETWLARDESLGRKVALKCAREGWGLGPQEARAIARLEHPNIVRLYDLIEDDGQIMVMEYVPGESLRERLQRDGAMNAAEAATITGAIASGLAYAHEQGVLHNDLKPENILIREDGVAKLADFGAAVSEQMTAPLPADGAMFGTVAYIAPEVIAGGQRTRQSDIFGLGVVLREALGGRTTTPEALAERAGPNLMAAIERATAAAPADRYESAAAFADALASGQQTARIEPAIVPVAVATSARRQPRTAPRLRLRRPPAAVLVGVAAVGLLGIVSAGFALGGGRGSSSLPDERLAREQTPSGTGSVAAEAPAGTPTVAAVVVEEGQSGGPSQRGQSDEKDKAEKKESGRDR